MHANGEKNPGLKGTVALLSGAVMISFAAVFVRMTATDPIATGFYRVAIGGLLLVAMAALRRQSFRLNRTGTLLAAGAGIMFAFDLGLWHHSIHLIGPGLATILANCQVFLVGAVGIVVFGERFTARYAIGTLLAFAGLFLLFGRNWSELSAGYRVGIVLGGLTAFAYTGYLLTLRRLQQGVSGDRAVSNLGTVTLITAGFLAVTVGTTGESFAIATLYDAGVLVALAVTAQVVGWLLISRGLPHVAASKAGLILLLQPTLAFVWDVLFFARPVGVGDATGAAFALAGIYLGARSD